MELNTIEKQLADRYLKRYQSNLKYKPQGYQSTNSTILKEVMLFKAKHPKHGFFIEEKYINGKLTKEISKSMAYGISQLYVIQSEALYMFIGHINSKALDELFKNTNIKQIIININPKN